MHTSLCMSHLQILLKTCTKCSQNKLNLFVLVKYNHADIKFKTNFNFPIHEKKNISFFKMLLGMMNI